MRKVSNQDISKVVSSKLPVGNVKGAIQTLSSDGKVLECSENVMSQLKAKHPDSHSSAHLPQATDEATC